MRPIRQIPHHRSFTGSLALGLMAGLLAFSGAAHATPTEDEVVSIVPLAQPQAPACTKAGA